MSEAARKKTIASIRRRIEKCKERIAAERDVLRSLIEDAQEIEECANDAVESLDYAADRLSEFL